MNTKPKNFNNKQKPNSNVSPNNNVTMAQVKQKWDQLMSKGVTPNLMASLGYAYNNSPFIQNERIKAISSRPFTAKRDVIEKALSNIESSEHILRQVSQSLFSNYAFLKLNSMYSDILTYRHYFHSKGTTADDIKTEEYKKERKMISKWIDLLQPKRVFQEIVEKAQWEGKVVYYMRDSRVENNGFDYAYLQQLPSDFIKIVGWNTASRFTIMFNFAYFWQPGTSTQQFPPIFKKYFEELQSIVTDKNSRPNPNRLASLQLGSDTEIYYKDNSWYYWKELPLDECFTFSQTEATPYQFPNTAGLFLQAKDLQDYTYLQQELLQLPLNGVVMGTMPMVKDSNGTTSVDNYGMGTEAFSFFTDMFNSAAPRGVQLFLSPATNPQFFKFEGDVVNNSSVVTNALQQFNSVAGVGGLNSTTDKPNMAQVKTQQILESSYAERFYPQFENCINVWWKNKLKTKYDWKFRIKGSQFKDSTTLPIVKDLVALGQNYLMPELLSYFDLHIDDAQSLQDEVIVSEIYTKLQAVQSAYTQSSSGGDKSVSLNKGGRPSANENEIESDGTSSSISTGTNTSEGRLMSAITYCAECGELLKNTDNYPFCSKECAEENLNRLGDN